MTARVFTLIVSGFGAAWLWVTRPEVRAYVPRWVSWQLGATVSEVAALSHDPVKFALWVGLSIPVLMLTWRFRP